MHNILFYLDFFDNALTEMESFVRSCDFNTLVLSKTGIQQCISNKLSYYAYALSHKKSVIKKKMQTTAAVMITHQSQKSLQATRPTEEKMLVQSHEKET